MGPCLFTNTVSPPVSPCLGRWGETARRQGHPFGADGARAVPPLPVLAFYDGDFDGREVVELVDKLVYVGVGGGDLALPQGF